MSEQGDCPICNGSGDDLIPCNCLCMHEGIPGAEHMTHECPYVLACCARCESYGCGGSCPYCGGSGAAKDWRSGGPYQKNGQPA